MRTLNRLKHGFTLIEILVVIVIIGILSAIVTTNFVGARERAQDSQKKSNLRELKTALRLYYVDYHKYPEYDMGIYFKGCGINGNTRCPTSGTTSFSAGTKTYLEKIPSSSNFSFNYYTCSGGDDFRLKITLSNASDPDISESQRNCPCATCGDKTCGQLNYGAKEIIMCGSQ